MNKTPDYIAPDGETFTHDDMRMSYADWLDETLEYVEIGNLTYAPSRVLREVDPTAFRVGVCDHVDMMMSDGLLEDWEEGHRWREDPDEDE